LDTCIAPRYGMNPLLELSDMARDRNGITQFYLSPTHKPYVPLLPSHRAGGGCQSLLDINVFFINQPTIMSSWCVCVGVTETGRLWMVRQVFPRHCRKCRQDWLQV